jgi:hypothetical protein
MFLRLGVVGTLHTLIGLDRMVKDEREHVVWQFYVTMELGTVSRVALELL